jgi:hypothetical protein
MSNCRTCHPCISRLLPAVFCLLTFACCLLLAAPGVHAGDNNRPEDRQKAGDAKPASDVPAWPFFYYKNDPVTGNTETNLLWPVYVRHSNPDYTVNHILSIKQRYPTAYPNQFYFLWPLSGLRTGNGHDAWLFPILWSGSDDAGKERHFALFPAFYWGHDKDARTLNIAILQHNSWSRNATRQDRLHALWPLFWYAADHHEDSGAGTGSGSSIGVLPLFWQDTGKSDGKDSHSASNSGGVLLLNWWCRNRHSHTGPNGEKTTGSSASDNLFPLFRRSNSAYDTTSPQGTRR